MKRFLVVPLAVAATLAFTAAVAAANENGATVLTGEDFISIDGYFGPAEYTAVGAPNVTR